MPFSYLISNTEYYHLRHTVLHNSRMCLDLLSKLLKLGSSRLCPQRLLCQTLEESLLWATKSTGFSLSNRATAARHRWILGHHTANVMCNRSSSYSLTTSVHRTSWSSFSHTILLTLSSCRSTCSRLSRGSTLQTLGRRRRAAFQSLPLRCSASTGHKQFW